MMMCEEEDIDLEELQNGDCTNGCLKGIEIMKGGDRLK